MRILTPKVTLFAGLARAALPIPKSKPVSPAQRAYISLFKSQDPAKNIIHTAVRRPDDLHTYLLLSSSARRPLLTLWTTNWCPTCKTVSPLLQSLISGGVGEAEGGVEYCEVEFDSPDVMSEGLGLRYMITSVPTLLSFDAGEAQTTTKVMDGRKLADRRFLEDWIRNEARRQGQRGGGGSW